MKPIKLMNWRRWMLLSFLAAVPAAAIAGITPQGITPQGITPQGITPQGITPQGITPQGITPQGITPQGITPQGITPQGITPQGITPQGTQVAGVALLGTDLVAADSRGVDIGSVEIRGTTSGSAIVPHELTSVPGMSTGTGDYISVGGAFAGGSAVGHYAVAHLLDVAGNPAEDVDLYVAAEKKDPVPNLLHRAQDQDNRDVMLYTVFMFHKWSGQWMSLCPFHADTGGATAMAIPEDPAFPSKFIFACTATGVAAKCARIWGFRPWIDDASAYVFDTTANDWVLTGGFDMRRFYNGCKVAARAAYCQDRHSFTRNGTLVDLFDTRQFIWPNAIENPLNALVDDSKWMLAQEYFVNIDPIDPGGAVRASALQRSRWRELTPNNTCSPEALAGIDRLERDHIEDGRWASPLTGAPRIQVFSPNYCTHNEHVIGPGLPWDCSPCTTAVCKTNPHCCALDPGVNSWDATCTAAAAATCTDGATPWPTGKVWPDDVPAATAPVKYLFSPGGAVARVDGTSVAAGEGSAGSAATVSGWACDPEWPGAAVTVELYANAPREQPGSLSLGTVQADRALADPLAREVSAVCDGPNRTSARHGFSFPLPAGTKGSVYAYARDVATIDGPAAPPTLLRNGIVRVPTCAHSEHETGAALDGGSGEGAGTPACSACVSNVCATSPECCAVAWTASCAAAAATACGPADTSAAADSRAFTAVTTGWIEAPASGAFTFRAAGVPSRLFVNGSKVLDWLEGPGATEGSIELREGGRYHLRWDRLQAQPAAAGTAGLTWQLPGASAQSDIPPSLLYGAAPGAGSGLAARYIDGGGVTTVNQVDATVDVSAKKPPPAGITPNDYRALWDGEVIPLFSEDYTFTAVGAGTFALQVAEGTILTSAPSPAAPPSGSCSHSLCEVGDKLAASTTLEPTCDGCVDTVCAVDDYCCNGGYLSYYSTEPAWDAKCVAEAQTLCGFTCPNKLPSPTTREVSSVAVPLQAGVRYRIRFAVRNNTGDPNVQLLWSSARQVKEIIPTSSLFPSRAAAGNGAGLNVLYFGVKQNGGGPAGPDLVTPRAAGVVADLSLAQAVGTNGLPLYDVLAAAPTPASLAAPHPPIFVEPKFLGHVAPPTLSVKLQGFGGVTGGSVHAQVLFSSTEVFIPVQPDGTFQGEITVPGTGPRLLVLRQSTDRLGSCAAPAACSNSILWPLFVDAPAATPLAPPPQITAPRDPTASPIASNDTFTVNGKGVPGDVQVCDFGFVGLPGVTAENVTAGTNGTIDGQITLTRGDTDPNLGWHKLKFTQTGDCTSGTSPPVFISVGIKPPTVEFPRNGAQVNCQDPTPGQSLSFGFAPYSQATFGRVLVAEETGRQPLRFIQREAIMGTQPAPNGQFPFVANLNLEPGKHMLYFFQAPNPPTGSTQDEIDAHYRFFASIADTPRSRVVVNVPPPPMTRPFRQRTILSDGPILNINVGNCVGGQGIFGCAQPNADVVVHEGPRSWVKRADADGNWQLPIDLGPGWHILGFTQVLDSRVGGAWSESCPKDTLPVGTATTGKVPTLRLPQDIVVEAASPAGAQVGYLATATTADGRPAVVNCVPASGATFPIGVTDVLCTAIDPATSEVNVGSFAVFVQDGPPVVNVPAGGITAEAQNGVGAFVSYDITATDAVSGIIPAECVPSAPSGSPALFLLDHDTPVSCQATDEAGNVGTGAFVVRVRDTQPPSLCALPDLKVESNAAGGAVVRFATCATDVVDGATPVVCDRPSGSFFATGKTQVTCTSRDKHGNTAPPSRFVVSVGDSTAPRLILPAIVNAVATSKRGARVSYFVQAVDDSDPNPVVVCTPPSGAQFPLGLSTVSCTATDASGNRSQGSFKVRVTVAWTGLLPPINSDGSARFIRGVPVPVRFQLTGASAGIFDLDAQLFIAPIDAAGRPGPEKPATGIPPVVQNNFVFIPFLHYLLALDTRAMAPGPWQLRVELGDGTVNTARITILR